MRVTCVQPVANRNVGITPGMTSAVRPPGAATSKPTEFDSDTNACGTAAACFCGPGRR
jgi:hypothetical protein